MSRGRRETYYAGNSRILRPAATKAHCAMEGYGSLMAASRERRGLRRGLDVRWTRDRSQEDVAMLASVVVLPRADPRVGAYVMV